MIHTKVIIIGLMIAFIEILVSCETNQSTILEDTSCSPPCWQQITPGLSTKQDVLSLLSDIPVVDINSIRDASTTSTDNSVYWLFKPGERDIGGRITFKHGEVSVIHISPKYKALTIGDAVEKLGEPEKVLAIYNENERTWLSIYLLYPKKGYALLDNIVPFHRGDRAEIRSNRPVTGVWYFDPDIFQEAMTDFSIDNLKLSTILQEVQPWTGFGEITYTNR